MNEYENNFRKVWERWETGSEPPPELPEEAFQRYQTRLALDEKRLAGKTILDAGSSDSLFGKYLEEKYPGTRVVTMDLDQSKKTSVHGSVEQLPFANESFDVIVSHAVPLDAGELRHAALEMIRALKAPGEIRIGPMFMGGEGEYADELWTSLHSAVENLGNKNLVIEDVPVGEGQFPDGPQMRYCVVIKKLN